MHPIRIAHNVDVFDVIYDILNVMTHALFLITAAQLRAARALLGLDQRELAERAGLSPPTVQRMESSEVVIRCNIDSLGRATGGGAACA